MEMNSGGNALNDMALRCGLQPPSTLPRSPNHPRRSGRTTRIILRAFVEHVSKGERVMFVAETRGRAEHVAYVARGLARTAGLDPALISCCTTQQAPMRAQGRIKEALVWDHA